MYSLIIPVYKNEESIPHLVSTLIDLDKKLEQKLEVVFVVDGSPDRSYAVLKEALPSSGLRAKVILLSRNFGSFAAIRVGLSQADGPLFSVMAADLQEPPSLVLGFFHTLRSEPVDVVVGARETRSDPLLDQLPAKTFWWVYRKFVIPEMPVGGVDVFGCNQAFRDQLLRLEESHSSLVAQIFWMGFRRKTVTYHRIARAHGKSGWSFKKKMSYLLDSIFSFTDLPIRVLMVVGAIGTLFTFVLGAATFIVRMGGWMDVPGYATTLLTVLFFGVLNIFGIGLVGSYAWRAYENTKRRPLAVILDEVQFNGN